MAQNTRDMLGELQRMNRLLALVAIRDTDESEAIRLLSRAGFTNPEIGNVLGLTSNAVKLRLLRQRRSGKKMQAKKPATGGEE